MIKHLTFSILVGVAVLLYLAQGDAWVQEQVGNTFKSVFERAMDCKMDFEVQKVTALPPALVLGAVSVQPQDPSLDWHWKCSRYSTGFSLTNFLMTGVVHMWVCVEGLHAFSGSKGGSIAIMPHVQKLMKTPKLVLPTFLKSLSMRQAHFRLVEGEKLLNVVWQSDSKKIDKKLKTNLYFLDGSLMLSGTAYLEKLSGNITGSVQETEQGVDPVFQITCQANFPQLQSESTCFISGTWEHEHGRFSIKNMDQTCVIDPITFVMRNEKKSGTISAQIPVRYLANLSGFKAEPISGNCYVRARGSYDKAFAVDGLLVFEDIGAQHVPLSLTSKVTFHKRNMNWYGETDLRIPNYADLRGSWKYNQKDEAGSVEYANNTVSSIARIPYWKVLPKDFICRVFWSGKDTIQILHSCLVSNEALGSTIKLEGSAQKDGEFLCAKGMLGEYAYTLDGLSVAPYVQKFLVHNAQNKPVYIVEKLAEEGASFSHIMQFDLLQSLIYKAFGYSMQGQGSFAAKTSITGHTFGAQIRLHDGIIRLPQTYNFIDGLHAYISADFDARSLVVSNLGLCLHTGSLSCSKAVLYVDQNFKPTFIHVPVIFDRCLVNVKQDLFAMVSGSLLLSGMGNQQPKISGNIFIDRSQVKENIFSDEFQRQLGQFTGATLTSPAIDILCDFQIETKDPVRVDTEFLKASAKACLSVGGSLLNPELSGTLSLVSGSLNFPYKPLHISKGTITFIPGRPYDPQIELNAKNKLKKYTVLLQASGSLLDHYISMSATPPLTEEQIVGLLLVGTEEDTLNAAMPALIAQNVANLIFGTNQMALLDKYFKPLIRPFNIHLVPSFTDQSGRGGLRGALEIDVNDRWRALIQKNFSLSEDTKFELEYLVSDDITIRAIRDERRDVSAEVEMRWKL